MSKFEDHLWDEFVNEHGDDLATASQPAARRIARPWFLAGTGLGVTGVGALVALLLGTTTTSAAFAITRHHDGTVTVRVLRSSGIAGANARLRELGIRAEVLQRAPVHCSGWVSIAGQAPPVSRPAVTHGSWTIDPRNVPAGKTLALTLPGGSAASSGGANGAACPPAPARGQGQGQGAAYPTTGTSTTGTSTTGTAARKTRR